MATTTCVDRDLQVRWVSPQSLKPYKNNARVHSKRQLRRIAESVKQFGWTNPILVDQVGNIIAGFARWQVAREEEHHLVPIITIGDLTEAQIKAYRIADNRLAELAGWDDEILRIEFQSITELDPDVELTVTGFEQVEIDGVLGEVDHGLDRGQA